MDGKHCETINQMPPRWNAWTHMQAVQFDYEREPKMRHVRLCRATPVAGDVVRIGVSGVEVECVIVSVVAGLMTVNVKRTPAKASSAPRKPKAKRRA